MLVFVDLDGCLCDFVGGVCRKFGKPDPYTRPEAQGEWGIEKLLGIEPAAFWEPLGEEFWANLSPTHDWHRILNSAIAWAGGPENVALLTSPCRTPGCVEGKKAWVDNWMPEFRDRLIFCTQKWRLAAKGKVLVDDSDRNVLEWADIDYSRLPNSSGEAVLVPRPWNCGHPDADGAAESVARSLSTLAKDIADWHHRCQEARLHAQAAALATT